MGTIHIGRIMIKYEWIIFFVSIALVYIVLRQWLKKDEQFREKFIDALINTAIIGFLTYKFSIVLLKPMIVIDNPISILYHTGGFKGAIIGIIVSVAYLVWKLKRENWQISIVATGIFYSIMTFFTSFWLLQTIILLIQNLTS